MKISRHAEIRAQQRGISEEMLILISIFGETIHKDDGCVRITITDKMIRLLKQQLDRCARRVVVADPIYDTIITAYSLGR